MRCAAFANYSLTISSIASAESHFRFADPFDRMETLQCHDYPPRPETGSTRQRLVMDGVVRICRTCHSEAAANHRHASLIEQLRAAAFRYAP